MFSQTYFSKIETIVSFSQQEGSAKYYVFNLNINGFMSVVGVLRDFIFNFSFLQCGS